MLIDIFDKPISILTHLKEVCFFLCWLNLSAAVRALAIHKLRLSPEGFARCAIHTLVLALIYIALLVKSFKYLLYLLFMIVVSSSYKLIIRSVHKIPNFLYLTRGLINILLWSFSCLLCLDLYLLSVLVCTCLKKYIVALCSFISCYSICKHYLIGIAYMRLT